MQTIDGYKSQVAAFSLLVAGGRVIVIEKNKVYPDVDLNIVMVHGVYSNGEVFDELGCKFLQDDRLADTNVKVSVVKYGTLLLSLGRIPFVRNLVSDYVASRLSACTYKYPNAKTVVIAHSFGTWAVAQAVMDLYDEFRLDLVILAGSVVKRDFDWPLYDLQVHNFIGRRDGVVLASALWGTGWSGRYGFKNPDDGCCIDFDNVVQHVKDWDHDDYPKGYNEYVGIVQDFVHSRSIGARKRSLRLPVPDSLIKRGFNYVPAA